ncbi:MAG: AAA family ATPase, partial [Myxococcota bacterium]
EALQLKEEMRNDPARARRGFPLYTEAFMGTGFVKNFYKAMKKFSGFCLDRALITGVTPIVLDDMASGFNVISHLTLLPQFHALAGLTHADVALAVEQFSATFPECGSREVILQELLDNYDHYRFNQHVEETLFNPDMVFYYFQQLASLKMPPEDLLDNNCRTDYDKLRLVAQPPELDDDTYLESLFDLVQTGRTTGRLLTSFSAYHLHSAMTLPSLLFYMGLLTLEARATDGVHFMVPNRVIKQMHWQELYELLLRQKGITVNIPNVQTCLAKLGDHGELQPLGNLLQAHVLDILSSQDLKYMREEVVKVLFAGYIVLGDVFNVISEPELTPGGYCDLFLGLDRRYPKARWGWILEFKYVKKSASQAVIQAKQKEAREQLLRYCEEGPRLRQLLGRTSYKAASIICVGLKKCVVEVVKVVDSEAPRAG